MSEFPGFPKETIEFLTDLSANNDKDWFDANRKRYEEFVLQKAKDFVAAMQDPLQQISSSIHAEPAVNKSIFRINRDTRFSKDKTPYKDHLDMMFWDGEGRSRDCAALFFRLTPTKLYLGAGKHGFPKAELAKFRDAVAGDPGDTLEGLLEEVEAAGFEVGGAHYKRVPNGYDDDHPRVELLKYNALSAMKELDHPAELHTDAFVDWCVDTLRPSAPVMFWVRDNVLS